ncbi:RNA polymerase sigma-70 factor, ECF subfamily [Parapedobacter composti]|uniref:RNA polymerase sigma-70 factor, ECF subfamily n=1 Tax=Parapedobacter composti TaxID=623281 RepID=A0A1I1K266_9SPHI|nr:sigma-70 family RNA polymerase sigma factor [Parapedobacter composti]SFC55047.1 RNA polymerase sigma-70 factor, ECF subfamily [Parapedobacter composti]
MASSKGLIFERIYYSYYKPLYFFTVELLGDAQDAQDVVAETFVKYYQRQERFMEEQHAKAFLFMTARHAALNSIRNRKNHEAKADAVARELTSDNNSFFDKLVLTELIRQIAAEVDKLPEMQRKVFISAYFDGKTTEEIALELGINAESVYNNKKRALNKLRLVFKDSDIALFICFFKLFWLN